MVYLGLKNEKTLVFNRASHPRLFNHQPSIKFGMTTQVCLPLITKHSAYKYEREKNTGKSYQTSEDEKKSHPQKTKGEKSMDMEYKNEGGILICRAGGKMPDELLKVIYAMGILTESNVEKSE